MATRPKSTPSPEVLRYFKEKRLKPSFSYKDVWGEEHAHSFTVAKSTGFDILSDVRDAVLEAIEKGETFESFKGKLEPTLRAKGWWGRKVVIDPKTGEKIVAQLGSPRRLRVIYDSNLRSARAAGQWERAQRTKAALPYFEYNLGPAEKHRPQHEEKRGLVLLIDDPFWDAWYPPNGWGCKCWVRQVGRAEAEKLGVSETPDVQTVDYFNGRKGTLEQIPEGIDPGWHRSPGKARARGLTDRLNERLEQEGEDVARGAIAELWSNGTAQALSKTKERIHIPVAVATQLQKDADAVSALVTVSSDTIARKTSKHGHHAKTPVSLESFAEVQSFIDEGEAIGVDRNGSHRFLKQIGGLLHRLAIGKSAKGFLYVRTLFQTSPRKNERKKKN